MVFNILLGSQTLAPTHNPSLKQGGETYATGLLALNACANVPSSR